ncbi:MAG: hypothetical protein LBC09_04650, partial [Helicobacteraceae bacterium]|nr:hypothetical protein [Helicobacteraceae bacterium]
GALELREGAKKRGGLSTLGGEIIKFVPIGMLFDYLAVRLDPRKAEGKTIALSLTIDGEAWSLRLSNGVLSAREGASAAKSYALTRGELNEIALKLKAPKYPLLNEILSLLEAYAPNDFNIAEP